MTVSRSVSLSIDFTSGERLVEAYVTRLLAVLSDLRNVWYTVGLKVQEHIADRWVHGYGQIAPLATSTIYAKAKRFGYYAKRPGAADYLRRHGQHAFWWTGKALGRALGTDAFEAGRKTLTIDFGRDNEPRRNLERMHFGGKNRPARPVYDVDVVADIAQTWMDKFVASAIRVSNFGTASVRRAT